MSAYSKGKEGQVIALPGVTHPSSHDLTPDPPSDSFQLLPKIGVEMEAFFAIAKKNESLLLQERQISRKFREEIQELKIKCSKAEADFAGAQGELSLWNDRYRARLAAFREQEKLTQTRIKDLGMRIEELTERDLLLKRQSHENELNLKQLQKLVDEFKTKNEKWAAAYQRVKLEANKLRDELNRQLAKLKNYTVKWKDVESINRKAKETTRDFELTKGKLEKVLEDLSLEKRHREKLEELLAKERREKEIALTCLQSTEAKLSSVSAELQAAQAKSSLTFKRVDSGLKLDF